MHTGQLIAVKADTEQEAIQEVEAFAEATEWSDWYALGGRWSNEEMKHGYLLTYDSNPELFNRLLVQYEDANQDIIRRALKRHGEVTVTDLLTLPRYKSRWALIRDGEPVLEREKVLDDEAFKAWVEDASAWTTLLDALEVLTGRHTYETAFYDLTDYSTSPQRVIKRCQEEGSKQHLVVVDFHF